MRKILTIIFAAGFAGVALAQSGDVMRSWSPSGGFVIRQSPGMAAKISRDGDVEINWENTEWVVANPDASDAMTLALARLMLAIRDGSWRPMN